MTDAEPAPFTRDEAFALILADSSPYATVPFERDGIRYTAFRHAPTDGMRGWFAQALRHADADFMVYEGERMTFGEAYAMASRLAAALQARGVKKGDRVAIAMRNYPEWIISYMACASIGVISVALNAWWTTEELHYGLSDSGARFVVVDAERLERLKPIMGELGATPIAVRVEGPLPEGAEAFSDWVAGADLPMPEVEVTPDDELAIVYTSGSTGHPKGVLSDHRALTTALMTWEVAVMGTLLQHPPLPVVAPLTAKWLEGGVSSLGKQIIPGLPQLAMLLTVPLFHVTGLHVMAFPSFRAGRKLVMMRRWDAGEALRLIAAERISHFHGVPSMSWELVNHPDFESSDTSSLMNIGGGGAARPPKHVETINERAKNSTTGSGYGLTETNALGAAISGDDYAARPNSTGRPFQPTVEAKIIDADGNPLPVGAEGEICLRSLANMRAYWNKPEATAETLRDGFVHTGDVGRLDDEGFLYITDRAKDIVIRGGENISCREVEDCLCTHPAVFEAAVYGVPDEQLGEKVVSSVMLRQGQDVSEAALQAHVAEHLAKFKVPARILRSQEPLPRIASGKVDKRGLRSGYS